MSQNMQLQQNAGQDEETDDSILDSDDEPSGSGINSGKDYPYKPNPSTNQNQHADGENDAAPCSSGISNIMLLQDVLAQR